jgi:acetyl-CoA carboxylase, biotin carboxylase subunit
MLQKVLIANRGEIALRILRACRDLGLPAVVAYSEADRESLPVQLADEAVCIGPGPAAQSYLRRPAIITAAQLTGCDAIHPGYGFLAENAYMAQMCEELGITFIGPRAETIERMGDKAMARETMRRAGLPILPGLETPATNDGDLLRAARRIGFPVMLKAAAGGGGRGMRVVRSEAELERVLPLARAEAEAAFSSGEMYVERFLESPRHIEVQVLGDGEGKVALLGERDCSLQRRHQKLLEESPAPGLSSKQRQTLWDLAHKGTREIKYRGAGTLEFLMDGDGRFYFMEMNTRIQVEHPVTEAVTGVDLVAWQLRIAAGEPLTLPERPRTMNGHAIECRITAEDPDRGFAPSLGTISEYIPPGGFGVRVDSHLYGGYRVPPFYDSLLGKVIVWAETRDEAVDRMRRALEETVIGGIATTVPFHLRVLRDARFRRGEVHTRFIEQLLGGSDSSER